MTTNVWNWKISDDFMIFFTLENQVFRTSHKYSVTLNQQKNILT